MKNPVMYQLFQWRSRSAHLSFQKIAKHENSPLPSPGPLWFQDSDSHCARAAEIWFSQIQRNSVQLDTNVLEFLRKVMNAINPTGLARLQTARSAELFCQVNTMLFSTEKILLQHLPCPDSSTKRWIGGTAIPFVCLSVASKPSQHPGHSCLVVLLTHRDLQPCWAPRWALNLLLQVIFFSFPNLHPSGLITSAAFVFISLYLNKISHLENPLIVVKQSESI